MADLLFEKFAVTDRTDCCNEYGQFHVSVELPVNLTWSAMSRGRTNHLRDEWQEMVTQFLGDAIQTKFNAMLEQHREELANEAEKQ
jgi:hypothetical protein